MRIEARSLAHLSEVLHGFQGVESDITEVVIGSYVYSIQHGQRSVVAPGVSADLSHFCEGIYNLLFGAFSSVAGSSEAHSYSFSPSSVGEPSLVPDNLALGQSLAQGGHSEIFALLLPGPNETSFVFKTAICPNDDAAFDLDMYMSREEQSAISPEPQIDVTPSFSDLESATDERDLDRELAAHNRIGFHPNIVRLYGERTIDGRSGLVMERLNGWSGEELMNDLTFIHITPNQQGKILLTAREYWGVWQRLLLQVAQGVQHLHSFDLVHGDIKPDNLLLQSKSHANSPPVIKIIDLGYCTAVGNLQNSGHELFASPAVMNARLNGQRLPAALSHDVFCFGMLLLQAFRSVSQKTINVGERLHLHIKRLKYYGGKIDSTEAASYISPASAAPLLQESEALETVPAGDPALRRAMSQLTDLVNKLTHAVPEQRISIEEACLHPFFTELLIEEGEFCQILSGLADNKQVLQTQMAFEYL